MDDEDDSNEVDGKAQECRSNRHSWISEDSLPILQTRDGDFLWNCVLIKGRIRPQNRYRVTVR
jgi:hypothetical protein